MSLITTEYNENLNTNIITLSQDATTNGIDGRVWRDLNGNSFWFTDTHQVAKKTNENIITISSPIDQASETITMCIDKSQTLIYTLSGDESNGVRMYSVNINTLTVSLISIVGIATKPLQSIISKEPDPKIWWNSLNTQYVMDLDGSNIQSIAFTGTSNIDTRNICMDTHRNIFAFSRSGNPGGYTYINKIYLNSSNVLTLESEFYTAFHNPAYFSDSVGMFTIDDYIYSLNNETNGTKTRLIKIPKVTWDNIGTWTFKDLTADYSIEKDTTTQFFTDGFYGYFYENNLSDKQFMWRVNLLDLSCVSLKQHDLENLQFKFQESGTVQVIVSPLGSDGCDPANFLLTSKGGTGA